MRNIMKRVPAFILAGTIVLPGILTGCGGNNDTSENGGDSASELFTKIEDADKTEEVQQNDVENTDSTVEGNDDRDDLTGSDDGRSSDEDDGILTSSADINLHDDGSGKNYTFTYNGEDFSAIYVEDNWKIIDSYKINSVSDMLYICQALIDEKPVHGRDMQSYRDAEDMAYEWAQHNMAYQILPDGNDMKSHAKDVDFDPQDQNKDFDEIYKDRTGKELSLDDIFDKLN